MKNGMRTGTLVLCALLGCTSTRGGVNAGRDTGPVSQSDAGASTDAEPSAPRDATTTPRRDGSGVMLVDGAYVCGGQQVSLTRLPSRLVFVVDRSSSTLGPSDLHTPTMTELGSCATTNARPATGITYRSLWDDLGSAVADVAATRDDRTEFGLTLFPGPGAITGAGTGDAFCTARPPTTPVAPALRTAAAIRSTLTDAANAPICAGGFTPTRAALELAAMSLAGATDGALILATDGGPNCGRGAPGCRCTTSSAFCGSLGTIGCLDDTATVAAITTLRARGIRTYVVGIPGTEEFASVLDAMAAAGGTARAGTPAYYPAADSTALVAALGTISDREVSCRFELAEAPPDPSQVNVFLDGAPTPRDTADGFVLSADSRTIELKGTRCEDLRAARIADVRFEYGCPTLL